jgi:hypothetical protein
MADITLTIDTEKVATAIKSMEGGSGTDDQIVTNWIITQLVNIEMISRKNNAASTAAKEQVIDPSVAIKKDK